MDEVIQELKLNTNKYSCVVCHKQYTKKSSLDKHKILCDFKLKTKREQQIEIEELGDVPNQAQLVKIVQELTLKITKIEDKLEQMNQWVNRKKRKLNVVNWLNTHIKPTFGFLEWIHQYIVITNRHFELLMENTLYHTIQHIFEDNLPENTDIIYPIMCFTQKSGVFYIYDIKEDRCFEWKQLVLTDMVLLLKTLQNKIITQLTKWKTENHELCESNDKITILFNKAIIKLMNISFTQDAHFNKIKTGLYNYLKTDIHLTIGSEFEF